MTKRDAGRMESADDYPGVVADLGDKWRVIECRAGEQWILQRKNGNQSARNPVSRFLARAFIVALRG
jgi:hypothetical protein